jgi:branched-chain amino acid transport system substrate-binding protein
MFLITFVSILVVSACNSNEKTGSAGQNETGINETIKIGMSGAITGPYSDYGTGTSNAAKIAIDEWNEKGGINGQKIELITLDDQLSPDRAASNIQQLLQKEKIHAGILPQGSGATMAALPHAVSSGIPFVNTTSQAVEITYPNGTDKEPYPNIFSFAIQNDVESGAMGKIIPTLGYKKVALLAESTPYGQSGLDLVEEHLKKQGIDMVGREQYDQTATSVSAQLAKLGEKKPELLVVIGLASDVATITKDLNRLGLEIPMVTSAAATAPQYKKLAGDLVLGVRPVFISTYAENELNPRATQLVEKYVERYGADNWFEEDGTPSPFFMIVSNGYDATNFLLSSIEKANSLDPNKILTEMEKIEITGATIPEPVRMSKESHNVIKSEHLKMGEYVKGDGKIRIEIMEE